MAKYLIEATYTPEGLQGLMKDKASGRQAAVGKLLESVGGKLESVYYCFGDRDVILIVDAPDNTAVAAISLTACATGLVRIKTTPLLTVQETDKALGMKPAYRGPGR
jgi:uncharacterized protein with GYD domain